MNFAGVIHSVVFGGFSAQSIADRIQDGDPYDDAMVEHVREICAPLRAAEVAITLMLTLASDLPAPTTPNIRFGSKVTRKA